MCRYRRREFVVAPGAHRVASAVVTKGRFYAGRFVIAPDACVAEPLFHILLFQRAGRLAVVRYLAAMALGALHRLPDVSMVIARRVVIAAGKSGGREISVVETDGEVGGRLPLVVEIAENPLLLVQPTPRRQSSEPRRSTTCLRL